MATKSKNPRSALAAVLKAPSPPPCILFLAPDNVRRERFLRMYRDSFGEAQETKIDTTKLDEKALVRVREELAALSLFTPNRRFIFSRIDEAKAAISNELIKIFEKAPQDVQVICSGAKLPSNSKFLKAFASNGMAFAFENPKGAELKRWIEKELSAQGVSKYPDPLIEAITQYSTLHSGEKGAAILDAAASAVEKAALYADDGELVPDDIKELFPEIPDPNQFQLIDAITAGRPGRAELIAEQLIQGGKHPFLLVNLLYRTFSIYLQIAYQLRKGVPTAEIRHSLGMNEWVFGKHISGVKPYSIAKLKKGLEEIAETDSKLKGRALQPDLLLSGLVRRLAP